MDPGKFLLDYLKYIILLPLVVIIPVIIKQIWRDIIWEDMWRKICSLSLTFAQKLCVIWLILTICFFGWILMALTFNSAIAPTGLVDIIAVVLVFSPIVGAFYQYRRQIMLHKDGIKRSLHSFLLTALIIVGIPMLGLALILYGAEIGSHSSLKLDAGAILFLIGLMIVGIWWAWIKNLPKK